MTRCFRISLFILVFCLFTTSVFAEAKEKYIIAIIGDSLMAGYGLEEKEGISWILAERLGKENINIEVKNYSRIGASSGYGVEIINDVIKLKPDIAVIELGYNDTGRGLFIDQTHANLEYMVRKLSENDIKVLLCGVESPLGHDVSYSKKFTRIYENIADAYDTAFYPDILRGVSKNERQYDGLHPNKDGARKIAEGILPEIQRIINR